MKFFCTFLYFKRGNSLTFAKNYVWRGFFCNEKCLRLIINFKINFFIFIISGNTFEHHSQMQLKVKDEKLSEENLKKVNSLFCQTSSKLNHLFNFYRTLTNQKYSSLDWFVFFGEQLLVISQMNILENVLFLIGFVILMNVFKVLLVKDVLEPLSYTLLW